MSNTIASLLRRNVNIPLGKSHQVAVPAALVAVLGVLTLCASTCACCTLFGTLDQTSNSARPLPTDSPALTATLTPTNTPEPMSRPTDTPYPSLTPSATIEPTRVLVRVVEVVDGNTIKVEMGDHERTVRYIGVDTPAPGSILRSPEWLSDEATEANRQLVERRVVYLEKDSAISDTRTQLLRYVFLPDDTFVNVEIIRQGYARVDQEAADARYYDQLLAAQHEAEQAVLGLWGPTPTATPTRTPRPTNTPRPTRTPTAVPIPSSEPTSTPQPTEPPQATSPPSPPCDCSADLYNCSDFTTRRAAQTCYDYCLAQGRGDIHQLDRDNDGIACE